MPKKSFNCTSEYLSENNPTDVFYEILNFIHNMKDHDLIEIEYNNKKVTFEKIEERDF